MLAVFLGALLVAATAAGQPAAPDSVRTNLWLTEALMAEIVTSVAGTLPAAPAAVRLVPGNEEPATELMGAVTARVLGARGYALYDAVSDSAGTAPVDAVFGYKVLAVDLDYPSVGRTLGLWRRWVERSVTVTALVDVAEGSSGRVLFRDRVVRSFGDRVPDGDFGAVNSGTYPFTSGEPSESGWQKRVEQIVVLGALAGLVAIYFANTRD